MHFGEIHLVMLGDLRSCWQMGPEIQPLWVDSNPKSISVAMILNLALTASSRFLINLNNFVGQFVKKIMRAAGNFDFKVK